MSFPVVSWVSRPICNLLSRSSPFYGQPPSGGVGACIWGILLGYIWYNYQGSLTPLLEIPFPPSAPNYPAPTEGRTPKPVNSQSQSLNLNPKHSGFRAWGPESHILRSNHRYCVTPLNTAKRIPHPCTSISAKIGLNSIQQTSKPVP